jgi:hypothetical protein
MKGYLVVVILAVIMIACNDSSKINESKNLNMNTKSNINSQDSFKLFPVFVERVNLKRKEYKFSIYSFYSMPKEMYNDSSYYCIGNYLFAFNQKGVAIDSLLLVGGLIKCEYDVIFQDFTKQLQFSNPIFCISSASGSDHYHSEFIEFSNGSLKKLFELNYKPLKLYRKDKHTISGLIKDRDELVNDFQDYPFSVSLDNYQVTYEKPVNQKINYQTEVIENFRGYLLSLNNIKTEYLVKKGTSILVDSLNREKKTVRIVIHDTLVVYVPFDIIKNKILVNAAG